VIGEQVRRLGFHAVVLMLVPNTGQLEVAYATFTPEMRQKAERITELPILGYRFTPPPGGYYARILIEKHALYDAQGTKTIAEAFGESHAQYAGPTAQALDIAERIGATLLIEGQVRGILIVNGSGLREEDVPAISGFANQTAIALENAERIAEGRRQQEALRALSARLVRTQEAEQARIARELHDETGQILTAMSLHLTQAIQDLIEPSAGTDPETLRRLDQTRALAEQTTRQIRDLCVRLRPSILDEMGLVPALRWLTNWFARQFEIQVRFHPQGADARLPGEVETTLYRIAQEGLTNVVRYAQAETVSVDLKRLPTSVHLTVEDDGVGFDVATLPGSLALPGSSGREPSQFDDTLGESTGLLGMQERVRLIDGQLDLHSQPGQGTRLSVTIPLEQG
jgi:signal transduction histidine kinase